MTYHSILCLYLGIAEVVDKNTNNWKNAQSLCLARTLVPSNVQSIRNKMLTSTDPNLYAQPYWTGIMREYTIMHAQGLKLMF